MEKIKVDVLINGSLICRQRVGGGGKIYSCEKENLSGQFDTNGALVINGSVAVDSFDSKDYTVVVTGVVVTKGGCNGSL